ncbi:MAG: DUF6494 family protein [Vulcanimicrobiaceae bacterium]
MDEDRFNLTLRKFLKEVGVTSQREVEKKVREALATGSLQGNEKLETRMTFEIDSLAFTHVVDGRIELS